MTPSVLPFSLNIIREGDRSRDKTADMWGVKVSTHLTSLHFRFEEEKKMSTTKLAFGWSTIMFQISWRDWRWLYFVGVAPSPPAKSLGSSLLCWKKKANFCSASCRFLKEDRAHGYAPLQPTGGKQHLCNGRHAKILKMWVQDTNQPENIFFYKLKRLM